MKLHLPVKLFRAILSLFATAPVLIPAALVADTITVDLSTQYRNIGVQLAPYVHKMDGNEYIFRIPRIDDPWASYVFEQVSLQTQSVQNNGLKPADASGTSNTSWYFTSLDPESPANININNMFSPNLINVVSNEGQDTYIQFDGLGRVDINSNNWYQYGNPSNDEAYYGNLFYLERGSLLFTNNTEVLLENNGHLNSPTGAICGVNSDGEGEIRFEGNGTVTISGNASGWDSFYDYAKPEGQQPPLGGAIVASSPLIFRNNGSITAQANKVRDSGSGAFVYSSSSVLFEGNESISLLGNTSASGGIVIDAPIITFAGNGEPTLNPDFPEIIDDVIALRNRYFPKAKVSVLSNATMAGKEEIFLALRKVDNPILKIDAPADAGVAVINRPSGPYSLDSVISSLKRFDGDFILQTMFLKGPGFDSSAEDSVKAWTDIVRELHPREVMVYTIDRETPDKDLRKATPEELDAISDKVRELGIMCETSY